MTPLFENAHIRVTRNDTDEIFVENLTSGVTIRITDAMSYIRITTDQDSLLLPDSYNGKPAIRVARGSISKITRPLNTRAKNR